MFLPDTNVISRARKAARCHAGVPVLNSVDA